MAHLAASVARLPHGGRGVLRSPELRVDRRQLREEVRSLAQSRIGRGHLEGYEAERPSACPSNKPSNGELPSKSSKDGANG